MTRGCKVRLAAAALLFSLASAAARAADPIRIYAAGSLGVVIPELVIASGLAPDQVAAPVFGPAGVLRQRMMAGETADLFASADMAQPTAIASAKGSVVIPFARNRMCVAAPAKLGLTPENMLAHMLSPDFRLAASTPGADPGGDYARAVFARAERVHPGAEAALTAKALLLLGGPGSMTPQPGHSPIATIFLGNHADGLLYYCSGTAGLLREVPDMVSLPVPDALEVGPVYGLTLLSNRPEAEHLALFMLSERGQAILVKAGLLAVLAGR